MAGINRNSTNFRDKAALPLLRNITQATPRKAPCAPHLSHPLLTQGSSAPRPLGESASSVSQGSSPQCAGGQRQGETSRTPASTAQPAPGPRAFVVSHVASGSPPTGVLPSPPRQSWCCPGTRGTHPAPISTLPAQHPPPPRRGVAEHKGAQAVPSTQAPFSPIRVRKFQNTPRTSPHRALPGRSAGEALPRDPRDPSPKVGTTWGCDPGCSPSPPPARGKSRAVEGTHHTREHRERQETRAKARWYFFIFSSFFPRPEGGTSSRQPPLPRPRWRSRSRSARMGLRVRRAAAPGERLRGGSRAGRPLRGAHGDAGGGASREDSGDCLCCRLVRARLLQPLPPPPPLLPLIPPPPARPPAPALPPCRRRPTAAAYSPAHSQSPAGPRHLTHR